MEDLFLGKPMKYWLELDKMPKQLNVQNLILEIVQLKGKLSFTESRLKEVMEVLTKSY